ncbi:N-acetylmuramoyl-L-alanine amidase [Yersinia entomophaga]|uniref:N-acetylmuramoyl-L-alanine amidase n=2 Tax=Yersiniaceae TaxID=1903411 RepID=UPI000EAC52C8
MKQCFWMLFIMLLVPFHALGAVQEDKALVDQGSFMLNDSRQAMGVDRRIRFLVLHYTALNFPESLNVLTTEQVSAHYLVPAYPPRDHHSGKPVAWQLVPEHLRAWHAGVSSWRGRTNLNDTSIGIEQVNPGFTSTLLGKIHWYPYTPQQIELVTALAHKIIERYEIEPRNVVAHSDIAPQRKEDPGPLFPWEHLAKQGIGAWPDVADVQYYLGKRRADRAVPVMPLLAKLSCYGYEITPDMTPEQQRRVISAFQMHFRPSDIRGLPDAETEAIADALLVKYHKPEENKDVELRMSESALNSVSAECDKL